MNLADFETAVRYHLPLSVFVFNDQSVGQERHDLAHKGLPVHYADVPSPDFARLAQGFGVKGYRVESPDQLQIIDQALEEADGPFIVDVRINGDVELPISWEIAQHLS